MGGWALKIPTFLRSVDNDPLRRAKACKAMPVAVVDTPDQVNAESGFLCLAIGDFELT